MQIELWRVLDEGGQRILLKTVRTNREGRTDAPLLADEDLVEGVYELVFGVGEYFHPYFGEQGMDAPATLFLNQVPVRFGIADPDAHYHVPLLTSPWSYSTYRGS
jgi:5-hydroxyisourate hydrolase